MRCELGCGQSDMEQGDKRVWSLRVVITGLAFMASVAHATTHEFFQEKTIHIIVGFSAGANFDAYARAIARHMGKRIMGSPTIIVENMPGAGSLVAANHIYKAAKSDGLTIATFVGGLFMGQILERAGIEFDARRFEYIGVPAKLESFCVFTRASGITSMEKWMAAKTPVKMGATAPGGNSYDIPRILQSAVGLPIHIVSGYKGMADIRLAVEGGEVAGVCGSWAAFKSPWSQAIETGRMVVLLQALPQAHTDFPKVPLAINFAKTEEARQLIQAAIHDMATTNLPYVLPPATPKERVQILRRAFMDTMKDPEFLADAKKSKLDIDPRTGEELERTVAGLFKLSPNVVARLKEVLK